MEGRKNNETAQGRTGEDTWEGVKEDRLEGRKNEQMLEGRKKEDMLEGRKMEDMLEGRKKEDMLEGSKNKDMLEGRKMEDMLQGRKNEDMLEGRKMEDMLEGRKNEDMLEGRKNEDMLEGRKNEDMLEGRKNEDMLEGRKNEDMLVTTESEDLGRVFERRRRVYQQVCRNWKKRTGAQVPGVVRSPFLYLPANFSYCGVPKVGITFWKRVFFFLFNKASARRTPMGAATSPLDVDRYYVHYHSPGQGSRVKMNAPGHWHTLSATRRVMFSRDPWSRLWSAYVDKFILPDSWMDHGKWIATMRKNLPARTAAALREQSALERRLAESENSPGTFSIKDKTKPLLFVNFGQCPSDITFAEFLQYVVVSDNAHWRPVHGVCNPCLYQPHYLGKMETFGRDTSYIIKTTGEKL
ncbi:hypothetical protein ACOMHN_065275 [Nucella lapillus]